MELLLFALVPVSAAAHVVPVRDVSTDECTTTGTLTSVVLTTGFVGLVSSIAQPDQRRRELMSAASELHLRGLAHHYDYRRQSMHYRY